MNTPRFIPYLSFFSFAVFAGLASSVSGAVLGISDMTFSPDPGDTIGAGVVDITSYAADGVVYSGLQGPTSNFSGTSIPSTVFYGQGGAQDPVYEGGNSLLGLNVTSGFANVDVNFDLSFGQVVDSAAAFFMTEVLIGGDDAITVVPLDLSGNVIGDYSISITEAQWGAGLLDQKISVSGTIGSIRGVSFLLSDFDGTFGDLSTIAGLRIVGSTGADLTTIGYATTATPIPESASVAFLLGGIGLLVTAVRRRLS
ncbi:hypothetical protein [Coraliomargarita parva]|uniref:hypothetical protein n=1 Tax=Coraliomargarita parva TaxID=3014050 RepID=UPI0022B5530B|nr:hypothetical protein [Coraliomargarita parva]